MSAYAVGAKVGTAGAWVLSKTFHVGCIAASGLGSFGEGLSDVGSEKLAEYNSINEANRVVREQAHKAQIAQIRAAHAARMLALAAAPVAPVAPVAPAPMAAAA